MFTVEYGDERSQQSFDVFTAVVAELDKEVEQPQHLQHTHTHTLSCRNVPCGEMHEYRMVLGGNFLMSPQSVCYCY